jgi:hypothetical protein
MKANPFDSLFVLTQPQTVTVSPGVPPERRVFIFIRSTATS